MMKNLFAVLLALMLCLSLALPAFADAAAPFIRDISAVVSKEGGAPVYNWDFENGTDDLIPTGETIPEGTALVLSWEQMYDGELYYYVGIEGEDLYSDSSVSGYVKVSDLDMDLSPVEPKEENAYEKPVHFIVTNKNGAKLYEGPSAAYKELKTLKEGTEIVATYVEGYGNGVYPLWSYTEVDGVSGWVRTFEHTDFGKLVKYHEDTPAPGGRIITLDTVPLYEYATANERQIIAEIPADTDLSYEIYYKGINTEPFAYVEYEGKKGWIEIIDSFPTTDLLSFCDGYLLITDNVSLYEDDNLRPGERVSSVEPYEILPYDACFGRALGNLYEGPYEHCYRVTVEGEKYWVIFGSEIATKENQYFGGLLNGVAKDATHTIPIYASPEDLSEIGEIEANDSFISLFSVDFNTYYDGEDYDADKDWTYIEHDGTRGWIHYDYDICAHIDTLNTVLPDPLMSYQEYKDSLEDIEEDAEDEDEEDGIGGFLDNLFGGNDGDETDENGEVGASLFKNDPVKSLIRYGIGAAIVCALAAVGIARAKKKENLN